MGVPDSTVSESLWDRLEKAKQRCVLTEREYIRPDHIREIITVERVKRELPNTWRRYLLPCWDWDLEDKVQQAAKIIAILILLDKPGCIDILLADGLGDNDLPIEMKDTAVLTSDGKDVSRLFKKCPGSNLPQQFYKTQWIVWAPDVGIRSDLTIDFPPPGQHVLPFECIEEDATEYSIVYKGTLWPSHQPLHDHRINQSQLCFAVKRFKDGLKDRKDQPFRDEMTNLEIFKKVNNGHLIKISGILEEARCIFFPWAHGGNLNDFWRKHGPERLDRTPKVFLWALEQMVGLSHALKDIHMQRCRHGDLKPSNILHFTDDGNALGTLKIADFGVSRIHDRATNFRQAPTATKASTKIYEAPEAHDEFRKTGPRSRKYDCWSMGCILLEFVTWLLYDFKAIESCEAARGGTCAYYRLLADPDTRKTGIEDRIEAHPVVKTTIDGLAIHPRFQDSPLQGIVSLVESHLLRVESKKRLDSAEVHNMLERILDTAKKDTSSFVRPSATGLTIPEIFNQEPLAHKVPTATYDLQSSGW